MLRHILLAIVACLTSVAGSLAQPIEVLLITGQNNHDWRRTTSHLVSALKAVDRFDVTVSETPPRGAEADAWKTWRPTFGDYDVILLNYNGEIWPEDVRTSFERYVYSGGTVLAQHASNNPFPGWEAFERMIGLLWRSPDAGYRVFLSDDGNLVRLPPGEDVGAGHGRLHDWQITSRMEHAILDDMPPVWLHPHDELYHGQRGPAENMHILATAFSSEDSGGTGRHELVAWWIPYGKGKVLTLLLGHLWGGQEDDRALRCVGFRTMLQRSVQWLATGTVDIPIPDDFPGENTVSVVEYR